MTPELSLAIETSSRPGSLAARANGRTVDVVLARDRSHASDLLPKIAELLEELGGSPAPLSLDAVFVGVGPGSYTGLRVGIATALGLVRATGAKILGVPSYEALAHGALEPGEEATFLWNARAGAFYFAHVRREADEVTTLDGPSALSCEEARKKLPASGVILGDETIGRELELSPQDEARVRANALPRADAVLALGSQRIARNGAQRPEDVEPLYLRPFVARTRRR